MFVLKLFNYVDEDAMVGLFICINMLFICICVLYVYVFYMCMCTCSCNQYLCILLADSGC